VRWLLTFNHGSYDGVTVKDVRACEITVGPWFIESLREHMNNGKNYRASIKGIVKVLNPAREPEPGERYYAVKVKVNGGEYFFLFKLMDGEKSYLVGVEGEGEIDRWELEKVLMDVSDGKADEVELII